MVATPITVNAPPFMLNKPTLTVGPAGAEVTYQCGANQVEASPEQDSNDVETFCGVFTSYKPEKWTVTVTALQSYGPDGLWNALRPLVNTVQPFTILPDSTQPVSDTNPLMSGDAYVTGFPFLSAAVGEASEFDFVLAVQGEPTFDMTGTTTRVADQADQADQADA